MNRIKFSHKYLKMPEDHNPSTLIQVFKVNFGALSDQFIEYDTLTTNSKHYNLPCGDLLLLLLLTNTGQLWTTIRRHTWDKYEYYQTKVGEQFEILIKEEVK